MARPPENGSPRWNPVEIYRLTEEVRENSRVEEASTVEERLSFFVGVGKGSGFYRGVCD